MLIKISIGKLLLLLASLDLVSYELLKLIIISIKIKITMIISYKYTTNDQCVDLVMHYNCIVKLMLHLVHLLLHSVKLLQLVMICLLLGLFSFFFLSDLLLASSALRRCFHDHA